MEARRGVAAGAGPEFPSPGAGGAGLRYRLTPEGANVRLDLAACDAGPEVYVLVLEASG